MPAKTPEDKAYDAIRKQLSNMDVSIANLGLLVGHAKELWFHQKFTALMRVYARIWSIKYQYGDFSSADHEHARQMFQVSKILEGYDD